MSADNNCSFGYGLKYLELSGAMTNPMLKDQHPPQCSFQWRSMRLHDVDKVGVDRDYVLMLAKWKRAFLLWSMEEVRRELVVMSRRRRRGRGVGICLSKGDRLFIIHDFGFVLDMRRNRVVDKIIKDELIFIKNQEWNIFRNILGDDSSEGMVPIPIFNVVG